MGVLIMSVISRVEVSCGEPRGIFQIARKLHNLVHIALPPTTWKASKGLTSVKPPGSGTPMGRRGSPVQSSVLEEAMGSQYRWAIKETKEALTGKSYMPHPCKQLASEGGAHCPAS